MSRAPRYLMQRTGGPLVTWNRMRPPGQTKASDAQSMGSLGETDVFGQPRRLPRGGAPEYLTDGLGCACGPSAQGEYVGVGAMAAEYPIVTPAGTRMVKRAMGAEEESLYDKIPTRKIGALAATYHGYKRSGSVGWALLWGVLGAAAPLVTNTVAVAQGFGKAK